jgi:hypothetical protein
MMNFISSATCSAWSLSLMATWIASGKVTLRMSTPSITLPSSHFVA